MSRPTPEQVLNHLTLSRKLTTTSGAYRLIAASRP